MIKEDKPVVLVTGASGFVGQHLTPTLADEGWIVRRAVRRSSQSDDEVLIQSIGPRNDWQAALAGVHAVVHLAARVHRRDEKDAAQLYRDINTEGTLHLARCAAQAGVRQFIFLSTVLVHGRSNDGRRLFRETDRLTPRGLYGLSKAAAEAGLKALVQHNDMRVTVIRPPLVYGAGAKGNFALLARAVRAGIPLPFATIDNRRAFLSVQNLNSFISHCLCHPGGQFEVFLVADQEQVSTPEFIARLAKAADVRSRLFPMPVPLLSALLKISGRAEANDSLVGSLKLDLSKLNSTGWQPPVTLNDGLKLALADSNR
jgi:UDP-glucose 4-epimerase